jgi:hypothetical protein
MLFQYLTVYMKIDKFLILYGCKLHFINDFFAFKILVPEEDTFILKYIFFKLGIQIHILGEGLEEND